MRTARSVADAENLNIVAKFAERSGSRCSAEACTYNDDLKLALVVRTHEVDFGFTLAPLLFERSVWNFGNKFV